MKSQDSLFSLRGTVVSHDKNGRKLGYPTANIAAPDDAPSGVFAGTVIRNGKRLPAMLFVGEPVTLNKYTRRAEAHILDFPDQDLYEEELEFTFQKLLRPNQKFDSMDQLHEAMRRDEEETRSFFKAHPIGKKGI